MNVSRPSSFRAALIVTIGAATVSGSASSSNMELFDKPVCYGLKLKMLRLFQEKKPKKQEPVLNRVAENTNSKFLEEHENASFSDSEAMVYEYVEESHRPNLPELAAVKMPVYAPTKNDLEIFRQSNRSQAQRKQLIDEMQLKECMPIETSFNDNLALTDLSQGDLVSFEIDSKRELDWYRDPTLSPLVGNVRVALKYENVEVKGFDANHDGTKWVTLGEKSKQSPIGISVSGDVYFSFIAAMELKKLWPEKMYEQYAKQLFAPKEFLEGRTVRLPLNILRELRKKEGDIYKSLKNY